MTDCIVILDGGLLSDGEGKNEIPFQRTIPAPCLFRPRVPGRAARTAPAPAG